MNVTSFRMQNFMGFKDSGWLELRSINLLFGRNSSGKSIILRALLLLKQSLYTRAEDGAFLFIDDHGFDFGNYEAMVHNQETSQNISFWFRCEFEQQPPSLGEDAQYILAGEAEIGETLRTLGIEGKPNNKGSQYNVTLQVHLTYAYDEKAQRVNLQMVDLYDENDDALLESTAPIDSSAGWECTSDFLDLEQEENDRVWSYLEIFTPVGFLPRIRPLEGQMEFLNSSSEEDSLPEGLGDAFNAIWMIFKGMRQNITVFLQNLNYLGPLRPEPLRHYYFGGQTENHADKMGKYILRDYLRDAVSSNPPDYIRSIEKWLIRSDFKVRIKPEALDPHQTLFEIRFEEIGATDSVGTTIKEVGFGISQMLPIIIQSVTAPKGSLILLEQPELHLHPRAQAQLGNLFVAAARRGVHLLIETHSEHLLLRLRRWVAETSIQDNHKVLEMLGERRLPIDQSQYLQADELHAYYVYRDIVSKIAPLSIDEQGEMDTSEAPEDFDDFFSDDLIEISALTRASLG